MSLCKKRLSVQSSDFYNNCNRLMYTVGGNMKPSQSHTLHLMLFCPRPMNKTTASVER